jgi:hypothetical protein
LLGAGRSVCALEGPLRAGSRPLPELARSAPTALRPGLERSVEDALGTQGQEQTDKGSGIAALRTASDLHERHGLAWKRKGRQDHQRTHNPSAVGSSPTRPTVQVCDLRKRLSRGADSGLWVNGLNPLLVSSTDPRALRSTPRTTPPAWTSAWPSPRRCSDRSTGTRRRGRRLGHGPASVPHSHLPDCCRGVGRAHRTALFGILTLVATLLVFRPSSSCTGWTPMASSNPSPTPTCGKVVRRPKADPGASYPCPRGARTP